VFNCKVKWLNSVRWHDERRSEEPVTMPF